MSKAHRKDFVLVKKSTRSSSHRNNVTQEDRYRLYNKIRPKGVFVLDFTLIPCS